MLHDLCFMIYLLLLCDCRGTEMDKMLANFILVSIVIVIPLAFSPTDLNNVLECYLNQLVWCITSIILFSTIHLITIIIINAVKTCTVIITPVIIIIRTIITTSYYYYLPMHDYYPPVCCYYYLLLLFSHLITAASVTTCCRSWCYLFCPHDFIHVSNRVFGNLHLDKKNKAFPSTIYSININNK